MRVIHQPTLRFDTDAPQTVRVVGLDPGWLAFFGASGETGERLRSVFRVAVVPAEAAADVLPDVLGRYEVSADELRFVPRFLFARGVPYRATFRLPLVGGLRPLEAAPLEFSLAAQQSVTPARVDSVFPSGDCLPENLLRFYVRFSTPMQRGGVQEHVTLLDEEGQPAPDVLYRAPVELWDRSMRHLTILLDPGRLKRGVGPHVALGPPLQEGREYTLVIGPGLLDFSGRPLRESFYKRFRVAAAIREPIAGDRWKVAPPPVGSRQPLVLAFPQPLDWAMLWQALKVETSGGSTVAGEIAVGQNGEQWSFTPALPWTAGTYRVRIEPGLEDVCGNTVDAAFDQPLRTGGSLERGMSKANASVVFRID